MSHIDEFRVNFFLYGCVLLFLNLLLHLNNFFLIFDASEGLEQVAHIFGNLLADSDSVFVHFFAENIQIYTFLFYHLPICIAKQHNHSFKLIF